MILGLPSGRQDIDKTVNTIMRSKSIDSHNEVVPTSLTKEDIKSYVEEVANELKRTKI